MLITYDIIVFSLFLSIRCNLNYLLITGNAPINMKHDK